MSRVIIAGAGAAGMMAAIAAADAGHTVTVYEKNEKAGKKIYITGKGRCNVTNAADIETVFGNIVSNRKFMYSALYTMTNETLMEKFEKEFGVPLKIERGNRVFPVSDKSSDIIAGLTGAMKKKGVVLHLNTPVKELLVKEKRVTGVRLENGKETEADAVIVATGGLSYPSTGSTGDGYRWAEETGHRITETHPALVPLEIQEKFYKELQGLTLKNVRAVFLRNGKELYSDFGEMLFTHFGISGPVILSGSSHAVRHIKNGEKIEIKIDLKPSLSKETLDDRILREFKENINKDFRNALSGLLPKSLIPVIIGLSGIDPYKKVNGITKQERGNLIKLLKELTLTIKDTRGFSEAIITQGGINVKDINPATMESKHVENLYFAGEVLDVDALTGGFNLQIAWSTGYLAGKSVASGTCNTYKFSKTELVDEVQ